MNNLETLQSDLDDWIHYYNNEHTSREEVLWQNPNGNVGRWQGSLEGEVYSVTFSDRAHIGNR